MTDAATVPAPALVAVDDEPESYIDYRATGGIHIVLDGEKRRLRAPRMRDYRYLYELWREEVEALEEASTELTAFLTRVADQPEGLLSDEDKAEDRRLGRQVRVGTEDATLRWWVQAIATLGVTDLDKAAEADDLPVFLTTAASVNSALDHWRQVPSRSGAR